MSRALLLARALLRWVAAALSALTACALVDYALRLPGGLRLAIGVALAAALVFWLVKQLTRVAGVKPALHTLALRVERYYPQLAGTLASGVEFTANPGRFADSDGMAAMAENSVRDAAVKLEGVNLGKLIDPVPTARAAVVALLVASAAAAFVVAAPESALLAMKRWFLPLGGHEWPLRTGVESLMTSTIWPADAPVRFRARLTRGYSASMRTWVVYRATINGVGGGWQRVLMNDQAVEASLLSEDVGQFESLVDLLNAQGEAPHAGRGAASQSFKGRVEYYFEAGDAQSPVQELRLIERPALRALRVEIEPPAYARELVPAQTVYLDQQSGAVASGSALIGSRVKWVMQFNKPLPGSADDAAAIAKMTPGFASGAAGGVNDLRVDASALRGDSETPPQVTASFRLMKTVQTPVRLIDEHGLESLSDRLYRLEAVTDQQPAASVTTPATDESVLASARVALEAVSQDDVGVEWIALEAKHEVARSGGGAPATQPAAEARPEGTGVKSAEGSASSAVRELTRVAGKGPRAAVRTELDLRSMSLKPGDDVVITAVSRDVYELDGARHEPARSTPRKLHVIDAETFAAQVRADLQALRDQAVRLEQRQQELIKEEASRSKPGQEDLSARLDSQRQFLRAVTERMTRNRVDDASLREAVEKSAELVEKGGEASKDAERKLDAAAKEQAKREGKDAKDSSQGKSEPSKEEKASADAARAKQEEVAEALRSIASMLDQGKDADAIRGELSAMQREQERVSAETRDLAQKTAGQKPEEMNAQDRAKLNENANKQAALSNKANELTKKMQAAAGEMAKDKDPQKQAAAKAMSEAASTAQRQGLSQTMQQASDAARENRMSDAGEQQKQSAETMKQMSEQLAQQDKAKQDVLRRRLTELADVIKRLVEQQRAQLARAEKANSGDGLDEPASVLRRATIAASEQARSDKGLASAAASLDRAASHQADAVKSLRESAMAPAVGAMRMSLAELEAALNEVNKKKDEIDQKEAEKKREQIKAEYEKLIARQTELRAATAALVGPDRTRKQQADLRELSFRQKDFQIDANRLRELVKDTLLFVHLHGRIDRLSESVTQQLRAATGEAAVLADQDTIASLLRTMVDALNQKKEDEPFAGEQNQQQQGGGGGGGQPPLVPPTAELKLLRSLQQSLLDQTRALAEQREPADGSKSERRAREIQELSVQQRELSGLGERLLQKMRPPRMPEGMPPPGGQKPPEKPRDEGGEP